MDLDFEIMFFESETDEYKKYESIIRRFIAKLLLIDEQYVELQQKKEEQLYRGEIASNVFRLVGKVRENKTRMTNYQILNLITEYCRRTELNNSLISFDSTTTFEGNRFLVTNLHPINFRRLQSLHFGTLIKLKDFVPHLQLADSETNLDNANVEVGDQTVEKMSAIFEHFKKRLLIDIQLSRNRHRFIVEYASINYIVISTIAKVWTIHFVLKTPALLYEIKNGEKRVNASKEEKGSDKDDEVKDEPENEVRFTKKVQHLRQIKFQNIEPTVFTKSNVIQIRPYTKKNMNSWQYWRSIWDTVSCVTRFAKTPVYIGNIKKLGKSLGDVSLPKVLSLPYKVHHAFQCLDNASYQLHDELYFANKLAPRSNLTAFIELIQKLCKKDKKATEEALYDLFYMKEHNIPVDCFYALMKRFEERIKMEIFRSENDLLVDVRRCILTPTRSILLPPLPYPKSRFLRTSDPDRALRVYAKDENYNNMNFTVLFPGTLDHCKIFLEMNLFPKLLLGIEVKDRIYEYVGSSTSQLRDIGMMFYATDSQGMNAERVRHEIGDLSHITNPAKFVARIGQAFSQPLAFLSEIDPANVSVVADVTGGYNHFTGEPYVFSDGVGMMSQDLAVTFTSLLVADRSLPISAIQIRHGGSKGMLTLCPQLAGTKMILRESMRKFNSRSTSVDLLKFSNPRYVYLNRPFVNILEQLGVNASVFLSLARSQFQQIIDSFNCKCKALEVIRRFTRWELNFKAIRDSEIDIFGETFFREIQKIIVNTTIQLIKSKARIQLPANSGRTMFGVLDETRILREGQVFVQYSEFDNYLERNVVTGEVLVTKFPCMHPGDIRKFIAVDIPQLRHICDCIVFPQQGSRPHPDMMAGSDLDGDEYAVIWDREFIFERENHPPMHYPSATDVHVNRRNNIEVEDMVQVYVDFIQKNNVGLIANAHLALSDFSEEGIFDHRCLVLSKQYPIALDFAKSGNLSDEPIPRATFYPDFMEKSDSKPTYKSDRALGKLYRLTCLFEENAEFDNILGEQLCGNESLLTYNGWQEFSEQADDAYHKYRNRIIQIQRQFGVEDEFSLFSGICNQIQKYVCGKNEKNDVKQMINLLLNHVIKEMKELFYTSLNRFSKGELSDKKRALASAWYLVTRRLNVDNSNAYYGLPWIVADVLCDVANFNSKSATIHVCLLNGNVDATNTLPPNSISNLKNVLLHWLKNNLRTFRGFQYISKNENEVYKRILQPIVNTVFQNVNGSDIAIQQILRQLSTSFTSGDEFENMLALSASMTLRRFRRTKQFECFTQCLSLRHEDKDTWVTCLAFNLHKTEAMSTEVKKFKEYVKRDRKSKSGDLFRKLRESGVEDVCCHVYDRSLFVCAYGKIEYLKKLRNTLTRKSFYTDVVKNASLRFE